jgi:hypothetical protein
MWPHWPWVLWIVYAVVLAAIQFTSPRLTQNLAYHNFADTRWALGIPRFGDVVSNAALLAGGLAGLAVLRRRRRGAPAVKAVQGIFFGAIALTALGSAYYHWAPDSQRLLWDRLPLGLVAATFPALILADRAKLDGASRWALGVWLAYGPLSVLYWYLGDAQGAGNLWPYHLVKLVGILMCLGFVALLPPRHTLGAMYPVGIALYVLAGVTEANDAAFYAATGLVSGHTVKHLLAALAVAGLAWMLARRTEVPARAKQVRGRRR